MAEASGSTSTTTQERPTSLLGGSQTTGNAANAPSNANPFGAQTGGPDGADGAADPNLIVGIGKRRPAPCKCFTHDSIPTHINSMLCAQHVPLLLAFSGVFWGLFMALVVVLTSLTILYIRRRRQARLQPRPTPQGDATDALPEDIEAQTKPKQIPVIVLSPDERMSFGWQVGSESDDIELSPKESMCSGGSESESAVPGR